MMNVEQIAWILGQAFPGLVRGKDYWVAHPVDERTLEQTGPAWIVKWLPESPPVPITDEIEKLWDRYGAECTHALATIDARRERDARLLDADRMVEQAIDTGNSGKEKAARQYRQALRDVPQQSGFPDHIDWPAKPGNAS